MNGKRLNSQTQTRTAARFTLPVVIMFSLFATLFAVSGSAAIGITVTVNDTYVRAGNTSTPILFSIADSGTTALSGFNISVNDSADAYQANISSSTINSTTTEFSSYATNGTYARYTGGTVASLGGAGITVIFNGNGTEKNITVSIAATDSVTNAVVSTTK
ncbi:MAG: hypothetical protein V1911_02030, partial [Candidatus Micrarchaeota archaeon]